MSGSCGLTSIDLYNHTTPPMAVPGDIGVIYMRVPCRSPSNAACLWRSVYPDGKGVGRARKAGVPGVGRTR
jgi:hypothetical protein